MPLNHFLEQARRQAERYAPESLPAPWPAQVIFFSVSDGASRATVLIGRGSNFAHAWLDGARHLQRWRKRQRRDICWLRIDVVDRVETLSWEALRQRMAATKRNYFHYGLTLDVAFNHAMLEQELQGNALLYQGDSSVAVPNEGNLARYSQMRFGETLNWPETPQQQIGCFTTRALFCDNSGLYPIEHTGRHAGYRQVPDWQETQLPAAIASASEYLAHQVRKSGEYYYGWFPCFDRRIPSYNALRHASSTYALLEGWELTQAPAQRAAIERALVRLTEELIRPHMLPDGTRADFLVDVGDEIKLGGNAVCILALAKYTELTGDRRYVPNMRRLAHGIAFMQDATSGSFVHVLHSPDLRVKEVRRIIYYDGEAAFALMRLYALTLEERWLDIVERAFGYFIAEKHWQAHDHWLSYCVNELTRWRPKEEYYRFGLDNVRDHLDFVENRITTYPTLLELMMAAQRMITRLADSPYRHLLDDFDVEAFYHALEARARYLLNGYFWPELAMFFKNPARIVGSFFIRHHGFRVRIDDVEHYLSGYVAYSKYLKQRALDAQETQQQLVFLGGDMRRVGNGIENATLRRATLFARRLNITPRIITAAWNTGLAANAEAWRASGELPESVRVESIYDRLHRLLARGQILPLGIAEARGPGGPGRLSRIAGNIIDNLRCDDFINSEGQILLRKRWQISDGKARLLDITLHTRSSGLRTFTRDSEFCAAVLEAGLAPETEWHFLVDKNAPWRDFVLSRPQSRFKATLTTALHSTHRLSDGRLKQTYAHLIEQPQHCDRILVLTHEQRDALVDEGFPAQRITAIPHHITTLQTRAQPDKKSARRVLYMARYAPEKQHALLIRAFKRVLTQLPDAELHTWGAGPLRDALEKQVAAAGLSGSIVIHSVTNDIARAQRDSACAVLSSLQEGFSLFALEALSFGTPLVSFAINYGPRDLLEHYQAGRLVEPGNEEALAQALIEVLTSDAPEQLRQEALRSAARFHWDAIAPLWEAWWKEMREKVAASSQKPARAFMKEEERCAPE